MTTPALGPLEVLQSNPIYFTSDGTTPLVLGGVHTWADLQDFGSGLPDFDFDKYLDLLLSYGHNAIRLWCWPGALDSEQAGLFPHPWPRSDQGGAVDGGHLFDVDRFNEQAFFLDRLHDRVKRAGEHGFYVMVMLFNNNSSNEDGWPFLPSNPVNNVNGVDDPLIGTGTPTEFETTYARRFVEELNDLDNVLWEVGNEIQQANLRWETEMVAFLRQFEANKPKQHLIGVNTGYGSGGATFDDLLGTGADYVAWIDASSDSFDPPPNDFGLPVISDTDHLNEPLNTTDPEVKVEWAWRSFTQGYHPIDMEAIQVSLPGFDENWNDLDNPSFPAAREAVGAVLEISRQLPLARLKPQPPVPAEAAASEAVGEGDTPPIEYLYFPMADPDPNDPFYVVFSRGGPITLDLSGIAGQLQWRTLSPTTGETTAGPETLEEGREAHVFQPPSGGGAWVVVVSREG